jgi:hypothetical protein
MSRRLLLLGLLLAGPLADLRAQWEIFAQSMPPDGSWATYRITTLADQGEGAVAELRVSSRDGTVVEGVPMVWLEVQPVKWLGSKHKGRLSFLIPRAMDKEKAARLIHVAREILFTDPVHGPWYMFPEDVRDVTELVEMRDKWTYTPTGEEEAKDGKGRARRCERQAMRGELSLDPPLMRALYTTIEGTVWRDATVPFGVVRAEWTTVQRKGSETDTERKRVELLDSGVDPAPPPPIVHGDRFSYWKLIRR